RESRVLDRAQELGVVGRERVLVVRPRPVERVADVDRACLQRRVREVVHRHEEEHGEPRQPRGQEQVGRGSPRQPHAYAPMSAWNSCLNFWLLTAFESKVWTFASISLVGKISGFFATAGSVFSSTLSAPTTGQM